MLRVMSEVSVFNEVDSGAPEPHANFWRSLAKPKASSGWCAAGNQACRSGWYCKSYEPRSTLNTSRQNPRLTVAPYDSAAPRCLDKAGYGVPSYVQPQVHNTLHSCHCSNLSRIRSCPYSQASTLDTSSINFKYQQLDVAEAIQSLGF
jgi:hypothetical protein